MIIVVLRKEVKVKTRERRIEIFLIIKVENIVLKIFQLQNNLFQNLNFFGEI